MLKIAEVQFHSWDILHSFNIEEDDIKIGDQVLVQVEFGSDIGSIINIKESDDEKYELVSNGDESVSQGKIKLQSIIRRANQDDLNVLENNNDKKIKILEDAKKVVDRMNLPMKLVDVSISFDGARIIFAFIANGRVDFRDLVKELNRYFHKSVRLQQLGSRDEAKITGDIGHCGRDLCCKKVLKTLGSVNSNLPYNQQISHRGSDRLSGSCGRLMCCLRYEDDIYVELAKKLPKIGSKIKIPESEDGVVIGWHTLKQTVDVRVGKDRGNIVEVEIGKK